MCDSPAPSASDFDEDNDEPPRRSHHQRHLEVKDDNLDYLGFVELLASRQIPIIPLSALIPPDPDGGMKTTEWLTSRINSNIGTWLSSHVERCRWEGRCVSVKIPITTVRENDRKFYEDSMKAIFFEVRVLSHELLRDKSNIVKLHAISFFNVVTEEHSRQDRIYPLLVLEAAHPDYPNLGRYLKAKTLREHPIPLLTLHRLIGNMIDGLVALHNLGLVHGDIKPENIHLVEEEGAMVAKIGYVSEKRDKRNVELGNDHLPDPSKLEVLNDIYSFGCVCVCLAADDLCSFDVAGSKIEWQKMIEANYSPIVPFLALTPLKQLVIETLNPKESDHVQSLLKMKEKFFHRYPTSSINSNILKDQCSACGRT
jgi:serine/threonine protein kinase